MPSAARSTTPTTPATSDTPVTSRAGVLSLHGLMPPSAREGGLLTQGMAQTRTEGKATAETHSSSASSKEVPKKKPKLNPQPSASPASVVSKAASPLPESGTKPQPLSSSTQSSPRLEEPQPLYHIEQKMLVIRPDIGQHRTAWVKQIIFKSSVASENRYMVSFPKQKQFDAIPIPESLMYPHPEPGAFLTCSILLTSPPIQYS